MSLRIRLILLTGLTLLASLMLGSVLVYWHAVRKVDIEMLAAIEVGEQTIANAVEGAEGTTPPLRQLERLVADLNGDRHLRATLIAGDGTILARSTPRAPDDAAPEWFYGLLANRPRTAHISLPRGFDRYGSLLLATDSHNEISEVWDDVNLTLAVLAVFCCSNAALVYWTTGRAVRPLNVILAAFGRISGGDYELQVAEHGPRELAQLCRGFNHMVERLGDMERRKLRLEEQLSAVQDEERAELARDLHDEIGPLLFAVSIDLSAMQNEATRGDSRFRERLEASRDAVARMQQHVNVILGRLRPPTVVDLGLSHSIEGLAAFWRTRYPAVSFQMSIPRESFGAKLDSHLYRIVQESISNALRHGRPTRIDVNIDMQEDGTIVAEICDDGVGLQPDKASESHPFREPIESAAGDFRPSNKRKSGQGLIGMRERVSSLGGALSVENRPGGRGVTVAARLPVPTAERMTLAAVTTGIPE